MRKASGSQFPDRQLRGFRVKLYPSETQNLILRDYVESSNKIWNWLCARARDAREAREAYAARYHGLVRPQPDQFDSVVAYRKALKEWADALREIVSSTPGLEYRTIKDWTVHFGFKQPYQMLNHVADCSYLPAKLGEALCFDYEHAIKLAKAGNRPPSFRKRGRRAAVRCRSGQIFRTGDFGKCPQGRKDGWLNCQVRMFGAGWISGRIGAKQWPLLEKPEFWLEGASVVEEPDAWYASIKQWVLPKSQEVGIVSPQSRWEGFGFPRGTQSPICRGTALDVRTGFPKLISVTSSDGTPGLLAEGTLDKQLGIIDARRKLSMSYGVAMARGSRILRQLVKGAVEWIKEAEPSQVRLTETESEIWERIRKQYKWKPCGHGMLKEQLKSALGERLVIIPAEQSG